MYNSKLMGKPRCILYKLKLYCKNNEVIDRTLKTRFRGD